MLFQLWCNSPLWTLAPSRLQHHQTKSNFDSIETWIILLEQTFLFPYFHWNQIFFCVSCLRVFTWRPGIWSTQHFLQVALQALQSYLGLRKISDPEKKYTIYSLLLKHHIQTFHYQHTPYWHDLRWNIIVFPWWILSYAVFFVGYYLTWGCLQVSFSWSGTDVFRGWRARSENISLHFINEQRNKGLTEHTAKGHITILHFNSILLSYFFLFSIIYFFSFQATLLPWTEKLCHEKEPWGSRSTLTVTWSTWLSHISSERGVMKTWKLQLLMFSYEINSLSWLRSIHDLYDHSFD